MNVNGTRRAGRLAAVVILLCAGAGTVRAETITEPESYLRLHYDKHESRIRMRDGVRLFTAVYTPKDRSHTYPMLMKRTPYSVRPYGENKYPKVLGPSLLFAKEGYIFVYQDVRGRFQSEGTFVQVTPHIDHKTSRKQIDESSDTFDTITWLLKNVPNHNGRVGQWGISYPGFYAAAGMIDAHPALKAVSPQAPVSDWFFDDFQHHGAFFLAHAFRWLSSHSGPRTGPTSQRGKAFSFPTRDGYQFFLGLGPIANINRRYLKRRIAFWNKMTEHPNRDTFWKRRNILTHLKHVAPAVMVVGGWYDAEDLYGTFHTYQSIERNNPRTANVLVIGPWYHGGWSRADGIHLGAVTFGSKTAAFYRAEIELPFFNRYLKGKQVPPPAEATVFETGANRWRTFDHWPPRTARMSDFYLHAQGGLSRALPDTKEAPYDEYISDPRRPVPFTETVTPYMTREYMTDDQRFASRRPDVLVYQTEPLEKGMTLAGPMLADLWVSTSGTASDWIVKVIDVFPNKTPNNAFAPRGQSMGGYQMMVRSEVIRGRFRNSNEHPEPFVPGRPTRVSLALQDVLHRFEPGHRLMVQIQSTWFPLVDRNPQKYVDNVFLAGEKDFRKATQRVYHSTDHPTRLRVRVLESASR